MAFAVIAPFFELAKEIREVCEELDYDVEIAIGDLDEGLRKAKNILQNNSKIEAFVSRGGTAKLIEDNLNIPVIPIEISTFDLIRAILAAKNIGDKIGVIGFKNIIHGSYNLGKYLGVDVVELEIGSSDRLSMVLDEASDNGIDIVIGDNVSSNRSEMLGIKTIRVDSGREAIGIALRKAKDLVNMRKREKIKAEQLRAIVDTTQEGIVTANSSGIITLVNDAAIKMLRKNRNELMGKPVSVILDKELFNKVLKEQKSYPKEIYKCDKVLLVQNISPVLINHENQGIVITMNDWDYVESVETKLRKELYLKGYVAQYKFSDIITNSDKMKNVIKKAISYAKSDLTTLIIGESGTGKEMIAQSMHNSSSRCEGPFIGINTAVMPENLLESELFGYVEGAFTGARRGGKKGLFELAHNGTLFLDEIGEMPLNLQTRLLRVLQEKSIMKIGGDKILSINTRVIAATHVDLGKAVEEGKFRRDLYYRLNVLNIIIPSLNERKEDIPSLVVILNTRISKELGVTPPIYSDEMLRYLSNISWRGNVRQIENILYRVAILFSGKEITIKNLNEVLDTTQYIDRNDTKKIFLELNKLEDMNINIIKKTMESMNYNKEKTCEILDISKSTLWRKMKSINFSK